VQSISAAPHRNATVVTLGWSEIMGGYNTRDTMVEIDPRE